MQILAEAQKLFAEKGYYGLGLSELLKRCGIPKGSFYYYFPDGKIQLIQEVLEYSYQHMLSWIDTWKMQEPTALAAFSHMADHLIEGIREKRRLGTLMLSMIAPIKRSASSSMSSSLAKGHWETIMLSAWCGKHW